MSRTCPVSTKLHSKGGGEKSRRKEKRLKISFRKRSAGNLQGKLSIRMGYSAVRREERLRYDWLSSDDTKTWGASFGRATQWGYKSGQGSLAVTSLRDRFFIYLPGRLISRVPPRSTVKTRIGKVPRLTHPPAARHRSGALWDEIKLKTLSHKFYNPSSDKNTMQPKSGWW